MAAAAADDTPPGIDFGPAIRYANGMHPRPFAILALFVVSSFVANAEPPLPQVERLKSSPVLRHLEPNPVTNTGPAGQTAGQMFVPKGFAIEVVAAEPEIRQPIAFAWDERGRIWVGEAFSYPTKRPVGEGLDRIIILADENGDGRFESRKIFAEKLNLVSGLEIGHGGVWVGAAPELLFIPDRNRDDKPDGPPEVLLDGFGFQDTHETVNSFLWGPDGWLYGIQGVFNTARIGKPGVPAEHRPELRAGVWRYHPVRREFEIFARGGSNPWGLDYDERGNLFMTHCRSYWGRGLTTHVIQGGRFWNQANANYGPTIIANAPRAFPEFRNFLLASARYDHGAGGAGVPGSDAIYGGHSHVGTMIYLADNWPPEYRGRLFTHNLGGHQINQQINKPLGSGYDTVHAGQDVLFCTDPKYVAIDLQYGPDGAVYSIDWYDQQHCHNPETERWDRGNGRVYRMQWQSGYKPVVVNLAAKNDRELVGMLTHTNKWYARTARRLLHERAANGVSADALKALRDMAVASPHAEHRLEAVWTLHQAAGLSPKEQVQALEDKDATVRGWAVQLAVETGNPQKDLLQRIVEMAKHDASPVTRRYLASAIQRAPVESAWEIVVALASRAEDKEDRNLPYLLWHSMGELWQKTGNSAAVDRAFQVARSAQIPMLTEWVYWYAATLEGEPLDQVVASLRDLDDRALHRRLTGLWLAMEPRANVAMPTEWNKVAARIYDSKTPEIQRLGDRLAAAFGDATAFPRLRSVLADEKATMAERQHAFSVLSRAQDRDALSAILKLLDDDAFRTAAINLLARFEWPDIPTALVRRFKGFAVNDRSAALNALTSRPGFATSLLDAVAAGEIERTQVTAYYVRRMTDLKNADVDKRVTSLWGKINQTPTEKQEQITRLEKVFGEAPLWAYSGRAGKQHFQNLCAQCHRIGTEGTMLGPDLTGAGKHGVRYFLENIIDPDAVIGTDFQMTNLETKDGDSLSGLIVNETASAVTLRTTAGETVVAKKDIESRNTSEKSLMPEALLDGLGERERIELLLYLTQN